MRDRHLCVRRADGACLLAGHRQRGCRGRGQRAVEPAAAGSPGHGLPGSPRRLRARGSAARPAGRRRRPAAARVRDLRRQRRRVRAVVRGGAGAAARRDVAHGAVGAEAPPAARARGAVRSGRARDRHDGHRDALARRDRSVSGGQDPRRAARRARSPRRTGSRAGRGAPAAVRRADARRVRAGAGALPALDVRPDLRGEGARDRNRGHGSHRRAAPRGALPHRRPHAPAGGASRRRAISAPPRAQCRRSRPRRPRRVRRPVPLRRRAGGSPRRDRCLRHPVPQPRADRIRRAHVRDRRRLRRRLDTVPVRGGHALVGCRAGRAVRRPGGSGGRRLPADRGAGDARRGARRGPPGRLEPRAGPSVADATAAVLREAIELAPRRAHDPGGRAEAHGRSDRPPAHARRRRRHRAARARGDPEPGKRLLRRRRRAARRRRARARAARRRAGLDDDPLPRARVPLRRDGPKGRGMRNFMGYDRRWLDEPHVGDHVGRSVWALGEMLSTAWVPAVVGPGRATCSPRSSARCAATSRSAPRPTPSSASRGSTPTGWTPRRGVLLERCVEQLAAALRGHRRPTTGCWFEDELTYDNARLPHALIVGGDGARSRRSRRNRPRGAALARRRVRPRRRDAPPAGPSTGAVAASPLPGPGDEQPLDASAFVEAELAAFAVTSEAEHGIARAAGIRLVPRPEPARPTALRLRDGRLQRRARRGRPERERGRRVDARLPPRRSCVLDAAGLPVASRRRAGGGRRA